MDLMQQNRDRLLRRTARVCGSCGLIAAFLCASTPDSVGTLGYWSALPIFAIVGALLAIRVTVLPLVRLALMIVGMLGIVACLEIASPDSAAAVLAMMSILSAAIPGASIALLTSARGITAFIVVGILCAGVAAVTAGSFDDWLTASVPVLLGWVMAGLLGWILTSSIPPIMRQVGEIGRAHRAERQASELEAQRRQSARLLHDTVLASLTLLAHSGSGVSSEALRTQARNDAHLLRQLRLGEPLLTLPGTEYEPDLVEETTLGTTLDSIKHRFAQLGLEIEWHGSGKLLLPQAKLDALLFAISECLENVRRHSGVNVAHVTITDNDRTVRAMITDAGKGFDPNAVESRRLGIKESVVARLAEVGGTARLFSSVGAGTTVLLEVDR